MVVDTRSAFNEARPRVAQSQLDVGVRAGLASVSSLDAIERSIIQWVSVSPLVMMHIVVHITGPLTKSPFFPSFTSLWPAEVIPSYLVALRRPTTSISPGSAREPVIWTSVPGPLWLLPPTWLKGESVVVVGFIYAFIFFVFHIIEVTWNTSHRSIFIAYNHVHITMVFTWTICFCLAVSWLPSESKEPVGWTDLISSAFNSYRLDVVGRRAGIGLQNVRVSETSLVEQCPTQITCGNPSSRFRTADGSCNNLQKPEFGKSNTPVQRILPPTYDDGEWTPLLFLQVVPIPLSLSIPHCLDYGSAGGILLLIQYITCHCFAYLHHQVCLPSAPCQRTALLFCPTWETSAALYWLTSTAQTRNSRCRWCNGRSSWITTSHTSPSLPFVSPAPCVIVAIGGSRSWPFVT